MMKNHSTIRLLFLLAMTLAIAGPMHAQEMPRSYVPFDIDPDYQKILRERLAMEHALGPFKDLIKQILADPTKMPLDPAKFKDVKAEDPKFKKALQDWLDHDPQLKKSLIDWVVQHPPGKQPADVKRLQENVKQILEEQAKTQWHGGMKELPPNKAEPGGARENRLAKLTEQAMKQTQQTKLGEWLGDSPAWKQAFADLRASFDGKSGQGGKLADWQARLLTPDANTWKLAEGAIERLRGLPRPNLERFKWSPSAPGGGPMATPDLDAPGVSDLSGPSFSTGATWLLLAMLFCLIGWRVLRSMKPSAPAASLRPNLGPWPVRPEAVSTRAELVRAFDYLALWTLGLAVKSWNHHAVAARWREKSAACAESADRSWPGFTNWPATPTASTC